MTKDQEAAIVEAVRGTLRGIMVRCGSAPCTTLADRCECAEALMDAHIRALEEAGWRLVPVEPTEAIVEGMHHVWDRHQAPGPFTLEKLWRAGIATAPRPGTEA